MKNKKLAFQSFSIFFLYFCGITVSDKNDSLNYRQKSQTAEFSI